MVDISEWRSSYEYNHLHGHLHHHDNHPYGHLHHHDNHHPDPQQPQPACLLDTSRPQDNNSLRHVDFLFSIGLKFHFHPALIGISKCSLVPQVHLQVLINPNFSLWMGSGDNCQPGDESFNEGDTHQGAIDKVSTCFKWSDKCWHPPKWVIYKVSVTNNEQSIASLLKEQWLLPTQWAHLVNCVSNIQ